MPQLREERALVIRALSAFVALGAFSACASEPVAAPPEWFTQDAAALEAQGDPDIRSIPKGTDANTDPAHWAAVAQDLAAAQALLAQSPPPAGAADAAADQAFEDSARAALEATRSAY